MKNLLFIFGLLFINSQVQAQEVSAETKSRDSVVEVQATKYVKALNLTDTAKENRLKWTVFTHLKAVRDWNNQHSFTTVPAGINPESGRPLSEMDRQIIANSAIPKSVHENLMTGLRKELTEEQVAVVLDQYTIGKVAFTMNGYRSIVPNLTTEEATVIEGFLKQAREQAVDYKNMKQISAIFEIYKTKSEQYLNANGRNWRQMYKEYTDALKAKKATQVKPAQ